MTALFGSVQLSSELLNRYNSCRRDQNAGRLIGKRRLQLVGINLSSHALRQDAWSRHLLNSVHCPRSRRSSSYKVFFCQSYLVPGGENCIPVFKSAAVVLTRSYNSLHGSPLMQKLIPAIGIVTFATWALVPLMRLTTNFFLPKNDTSWKKSTMHYVLTSYVRPLLLWVGATLICRALDPVMLPSEASQAVKQRLLIFVRSLSTVLAFAYCLSSLIQQTQKYFMEINDSTDNRNMGFQFAGKAIYSAVWVAAVSLFMELLGFSTQKWMTAGGLGTVLLTLAGREIFTNFLSSVMIHATRPFVVNEWIQTKIEGYEVSGTVEHVGWWSPTIIRGDDREAVHIPNHKFTVNVVRNLSQKTHWRIKTHLAISHLDVNKIHNIVADMRKVLAKNPQVEQQRLHRRVFLDTINPENQALMILISCFVKTSHFEEYLCVKEAVLQDLLRVISHHRARLATPIRTVQKMVRETDIDTIPFADTIFGRANAAATNRPFLLIEPSYKINNDEKTKGPPRPIRKNEEKDVKIGSPPSSTTNLDAKTEDKEVISSSSSTTEEKEVLSSNTSKGTSVISPSDTKVDNVETKVDSKKTDEAGPTEEKSPESSPGASPAKSQPVARAVLEDNIVLNVALDGSRRTLPIEDEIVPSLVESKELSAASRNDGQNPTVPNASSSQTNER